MGALWGWEPREAGSRVGGAVSRVGLCLLLEPVVQRTSLPYTVHACGMP